MKEYFAAKDGIGARMGSNPAPVLKTIAERFRADNPPVPVQYYLRSRKNFRQTEDYLDDICLHEAFPEMECESYAYAWARLTPPQGGSFSFRFSAYGPVSIWVNGVLAARTNQEQERGQKIFSLSLELEEGENSLLFQCTATPLGCGFRIGSSSYKGRRIQFFGPDREHRGMSGFVYAGPFARPLERLPLLGEGEAETGIHWYPEVSWKEEETAMGWQETGRRIFGREMTDEWKMVSVTSFTLPASGFVRLAGQTARQGTQMRIDGKEPCILESCWEKTIFLRGGKHSLAFEGGAVQVETADFQRKREALDGNRDEGSDKDRNRDGVELFTPLCPVLMAEELNPGWLYAGPFPAEEKLDWEALLSFQRPFRTEEGLSFWRADMPEVYLRPFNEGTLYGEWSYPLGVTMYGLLQAGRILQDGPLMNYVAGHIKKCLGFYDYCMWDKAVYGAAPFHNQLTTIDSLDDCGSFASALLEAMTDWDIPEGEKVSRIVAEYITERQYRLPDGTFYRNHSYLPVMNETMWADDMYMSIPFLCRYYVRSGESKYLDEAVRQAKQLFHYLFMPDQQLMSHIYDTHYQVQTKVPWGRGNGWAVFSLTELLTVLPKEHPERENVRAIYLRLCQGCLQVQGESGMWHQVLTLPDSYPEASCTAMFIYGFSRGAARGWFADGTAYAKAAWKGWEALCRLAIDWKGNLYGVCRGSGYSFSKKYYAEDLPWNKNDTHGTGIVLLAGVEVEKLMAADGEVMEKV